jgi:hypothetical protein
MSQSLSLERAWAAGFFDGEGCSGAYQGKLQVTVGQVDRQSLYRFQAAVGVGNISNPQLHQNRKPFSQWRAYGENGQRALTQLWPYLGNVKRDQALRALLDWSFRRVTTSAGLCKRGHSLSTKHVRGRRTECAICRGIRKAGASLPPERVIRAIDLRMGLREYTPPPLKRGADHHPTLET